jgi:hypothetical protein
MACPCHGVELSDGPVIERLVIPELDDGVQRLRDVLLWPVEACVQGVPCLPQVIYVVHQQPDMTSQAPFLEAAAHQLVSHMPMICLPIGPPFLAESGVLHVFPAEGGPPAVVCLA